MSREAPASEAQRQRLNEQVRELEAKAVKAKTLEVRIAYLEMAQRLKRVARRADEPSSERDAHRDRREVVDEGEMPDAAPA
jgi:hypothetical protein